MICDADTHARLKRDSNAWALLAYVGRMDVPALGDEPALTLELRNCRCHSTLAKEIRK